MEFKKIDENAEKVLLSVGDEIVSHVENGAPDLKEIAELVNAYANLYQKVGG